MKWNTVALSLFLSTATITSFAQTSVSPNAAAAAKAAALTESPIIPVPRDGKQYQRYEMLNERVKTNQGPIDILFVGDSITQGWEGAGKTVWQKYYGSHKAVNIGIGGDRTEHVLWRLDHGNADGMKPKVTVLMIGTNNSGKERNTPAQIVEGVTAVVHKLQEKFPETKILLLGIFPRGKEFNEQRGDINQVNQAIHKLEDNQKVFFLDFGQVFINADGSISKDIMPDYLHPNQKGYELWSEAMEPKLKELLAK